MDIYRPKPGTRLEDLDTPCLVIDLEALEHNFRLIADTYRDSTCKMRTHVKNLKSSDPGPHADARRWHRRWGVCR